MPWHMCYSCRMSDVASRELRNNTRAILARVESGESITITVSGRPVASLEPVDRKPRSMSREAFIRRLSSAQADAALATDLRGLNTETTDDIPWR
jgi:prevent-host-death family protein